MRGFLVLGTILATLIGWLFWAAPAKAASAGDGTDVTCLRVVN